MLNRYLISSILIITFGNAAAAKNTVLHCRGYQVGDRHPITDQIITITAENDTVVSIQLGAANPKDVINAPVKVSKRELQWSYPAVEKKYIFNRQTLRLQMLTNALELVAIFECSSS